MEKSQIEPKFGIVAIVDALGASSFRIHEALDFIKRRNKIIDDPLLEKLVAKNAPNIDNFLSPPLRFTFGDTIIFAWEIKDLNAPDFAAFYVSDWLRPIMFKSLYYTNSQLFFRGAISIGKYVVDGNSILGPAVADAAAWYEAANWIGIITTPTLAYTINTAYSFKGVKGLSLQIAPRYVKYKVPLNKAYALKHGEDTLDTWAIAWPYEFYTEYANLEEASAAFNMAFEAHAGNSDSVIMPIGTELKYDNTVKFFDEFETWRSANIGWDALSTYASFAEAAEDKPKTGQ